MDLSRSHHEQNKCNRWKSKVTEWQPRNCKVKAKDKMTYNGLIKADDDDDADE